MIPAEAVEAAKKVAFERYGSQPDAAYLRTILGAAAPHILGGLAESRVVEDGVELFRFTSSQREWMRNQ